VTFEGENYNRPIVSNYFFYVLLKYYTLQSL